jgi:hypothetical protein
MLGANGAGFKADYRWPPRTSSLPALEAARRGATRVDVMGFLRSKAFAWTVAMVTVAAFALPGIGTQGLLIGAAGGAVLWATLRYRNRPDRVLYRKLLQMAHGDRERVERLIAHEEARRPEAGRLQHIRSAVRSWERDLN